MEPRRVAPFGTCCCTLVQEYETGGLKVDLHSNSTFEPIGTDFAIPD